MVYVMEFYVDGGCRRNGYSNAIGAAAACLMSRSGKSFWTRTQILETDEYYATNQRAEILAIIVALQWALDKYDDLDGRPIVNVTIHSDSRYAVGCLSQWVYTWARNGWKNSRGNPIANGDLIQEASHLDDRVQALGNVDYVYIPRNENVNADNKCNKALDNLENRYSSHEEDYPSSSSDESW
ncbi:ribonuclease H1 [Annulohypoxylon nitens]|nr:ribonuclease H1 [Annulohypoxylon nitens]